MFPQSGRFPHLFIRTWERLVYFQGISAESGKVGSSKKYVIVKLTQQTNFNFKNQIMNCLRLCMVKALVCEAQNSELQSKTKFIKSN